MIIDPSYQIWKYLNKKFLINSKELNIKVYLAKNVNIEKTKFKITNITNGSITYLDNFTELSSFFNIALKYTKKKHLSLRYIKTKKLYRKTYIIEQIKMSEC